MSALVGACGGKAAPVARGNTGGEPAQRTATDGGGATPARDATADPEQTAACAHFVAVEYDACVDRPAAEIARRRALFENNCMSWFAIPGSGATAPALEACATALEAVGCRRWNGPPPECDIRGTLGEGAPCFTFQQCESGVCDLSARPDDSDSPCGRCTRPVAAGELCPQAGCRVGSTCIGNSAETRVCTPIVVGAAGDPCGDVSRRCGPDLYCARGERCEPLLDDGVACSMDGESPCRFSSYCSAAGYCAPPGNENDACRGDDTCASELVCTSERLRCVPTVWREPGETCTGETERCLNGDCIMRGDGTMTCQLIVGDGEPCAPYGAHCDAGLLCFKGTCHALDTIECG